MAPSLSLVDVSADAATEKSQALEMSSPNRGNGDTRRASAAHDVVSHPHENLQTSGEQRLADTAPRVTITTQARQAAAAQPAVNESPHPVTLRELLRAQEDQYASLSRAYEEIRATAAQVTATAGQVRSTAMAQEQMVAHHQAERAASAAQMQAVLNQFDQFQESQRKSEERAQKSDEKLEKMEEELKTRDEELCMKVEETIREQLRAAVDEERKQLSKAIKKEMKKEEKKKKNKEEKAAGKPSRNLHRYNIHVREEGKRLKELGSEEDLFQVASRTWREMDEGKKEERYGGIHKLDKERYERELKVWEKREVPVDQRKPAAKPTPEELVATVDPRESAADTPNGPPSPPEESAPTAAAALGPGDPDEGYQLSHDPDEGYQLSPYEQLVRDNIARNQERLRSLDLLPTTTSSGRARNQGESSLSRLDDTSLADSPAVRNRNSQELTSDPVGDLDVQVSPHYASNNKDGRTADTDNRQDTSHPSPEESIAAAATEFRPQVVDDSLAGVTNTQEGSTCSTRKEVAVPPPMTTVVIHRRQEVQGATVAHAEERSSGPSPATYPETAPFLGVERNSEEEPPQFEEARRTSSVPEAASLPDTVVNNHRDNTNVAVASAAACRLQNSAASLTSNGDGNTQESPSVTARRPRGKKRKNHSPYWYKNAPVYELEGYTDGTPLPKDHVWVEYHSGVAVQVKENELAKKLPARISRPRLKHDLFSARDISRKAGGSSAHAQTISASEMPFPVGYRFYHDVSKGIYHQGYRCVAEVKEVIGDCDGDFTSPNSVRRCHYYNLRDGSKIGEGKPLVKTIEKKKVCKN